MYVQYEHSVDVFLPVQNDYFIFFIILHRSKGYRYINFNRVYM